MVTASFDNTTRIWDLSGAAPVATVLGGHLAAVTMASFSSDGQHVVTVSKDHTARVWLATLSLDKRAIIDTAPADEELVALARRSITRCLTGEQYATLGLPVEIGGDADRKRIRSPPCWPMH